jgi:hypothetical protein
MTAAIAFPNAASHTSVSTPINLAVAMLVRFGSAELLAEFFENSHQPGIAGGILVGSPIGPA